MALACVQGLILHNVAAAADAVGLLVLSVSARVWLSAVTLVCTGISACAGGIIGLGQEIGVCCSSCPGLPGTESACTRRCTVLLCTGISVCAGGIIGLGEGEEDRVGLLLQLATLPEHPESVPINRLVAVKGTPLQVRKVFDVCWQGYCPSVCKVERVLCARRDIEGTEDCSRAVF